LPGRPPHTPVVSPSPSDIERASALCLRPAPGRLAGFFGTGAHRLALRALARPLVAGDPVVAVDGGNRFDPYEIGKAEKALGRSGRVALSRILVSRAFTCHQMEALLSRRLRPALDHSGAGIAVVFGLPETFTDADVPFAEACRIFRSCLSALRRLAVDGIRVVLVGEGEASGISLEETPGSAPSPFATASAAPGNRSPGREAAPAGGDRAGFFRHLVRIADPCLLLRREGEGWSATLRGKAAGNAGNIPRKGNR
jgi:hypothetical protein